MNSEAETSEALTRFRAELRSLLWPTEVLEQLPGVTRRTRAGGSGNLVTAHALDAGNAMAAIAEQVSYFRARGESFEWKLFSFDEPSDLGERLSRAGFRAGDREAILIYDLRSGWAETVDRSASEVRRVETEIHLADFRRVAEAVFKKDYAFTTDELAVAITNSDLTHQAYVAYFEGQPVSIGRLYTHPESQFGGLYGGGTLAEFRGQGIYRSVIGARAAAALQAGVRYLQVDALPTSAPILGRLGFRQIAITWPYDWTPRQSS